MNAFAPILMLALVTLPHHGAQGRADSPRRSRPAGGSILIAEVTLPDAGDMHRGNPHRGHRVSAYSIRVDTKPRVGAPVKGAVRVPGLSVGKKHLVKIYGDGVPVESFRFRFDSFATRELCLWFNSWYGSWSLWDAKDGGSKCRCGAGGR